MKSSNPGKIRERVAMLKSILGSCVPMAAGLSCSLSGVYLFEVHKMKVKICSCCFEECEAVTDSGEFDACGPSGTIKGYMSPIEESSCCGESIDEISSDLWEYYSDIKKLFDGSEVKMLLAGPEFYEFHFAKGVTPEEYFERVTKDLKGLIGFSSLVDRKVSEHDQTKKALTACLKFIETKHLEKRPITDEEYRDFLSELLKIVKGG